MNFLKCHQISKYLYQHKPIQIVHIIKYTKQFGTYFVNNNINIYRSFISSASHWINVKVPSFPESVSQAVIHWMKNEGDTVLLDEVIGELETDKTTLQLLSPNDGIISKLFFNDGDTVISSDIVCDITPQSLDSTTLKDNQKISPKNIDLIESWVYTPTFPESITEGDIRWHKSIGDYVSADDIIGEIETDKTAIEVLSPCDGIIVNLLVKDGGKAIANSKLALINQTKSSKNDTLSTTSDKIQIKEIEKSTTKQSQPKPTTLFTNDNTPLIINTKTIPNQIISQKTSPTTNIPDRTITKVKMTRIRETISNRLKIAQNTCAMLTTFNEVDMSNVINLRKTHQDMFVKKHNVKLGFMSAFIKSSCYALQQIPIVNSYIDGNEIIYHNYVDISVAVASPKGLVVPVIRNVQNLDFAQVEKILIEYAQEAKLGKLKAEDMEGGTFTISNGGVFGSLMGTPIINPPQSAILGIHAINERPVVVNGNIVIRPMMYLALTYDHRLIDGREAVTFLRKIKQCVEDPTIMLLNI